MDRRKFLAFIPSISAIPLIGKYIEKDKEKITIYQPEDVPKFDKNQINWADLEVRVVCPHTELVIARGSAHGSRIEFYNEGSVYDEGYGYAGLPIIVRTPDLHVKAILQMEKEFE